MIFLNPSDSFNNVLNFIEDKVDHNTAGVVDIHVVLCQI